jgi:integrase
MGTILKYEGKRGTSYRAQIRRHGRFLKHQSDSLSKTFKTYNEAKRWIIDTEAKLNHDIPVDVPKRPLTFHDLLIRYEQEVLPFKKPLTQRNMKYFLKQWDEELGTSLLIHLNSSLVSARLTRLIAEQKKPNTIRRYFSVINAVINQAVDWELLPVNPLRKIKRIKKQNGEVRFLTPYERHILLKACKDSPNPHLYLYVVLCLDVGLRKEECRNLRWRDIEIGSQTLSVWKRKNDQPLTVPFSDFAAQAIWEYKEQCEQDPEFVENFKSSQPLFQGKPGKPFSVRRAWERVIRLTGLEGVHIHTLRHSCAADLLAHGASLAHVKEILGHADIATTMIYAHLQESNVRELINKASMKFGV